MRPPSTPLCILKTLAFAAVLTAAGCAAAPKTETVIPKKVTRSLSPSAAARSARAPRAVLAGWRVRGPEFEYAREHPHDVAFTFDAGASARGVPLILSTLARNHAVATFFLTGKFCRQFPQQARAIAAAGMELGKHSDTHPHFTRLSAGQMRDEITRAASAIRDACGRGPAPLFRYPYGDSNDRTRAVVAADGYQAIGWTLDSLDSVGAPKSAAFVAARIIHRVRPGYIVLMHVSFPETARALPAVFDYLNRNGIRVVPVSTLMVAPAPSTRPRMVAQRRDS